MKKFLFITCMFMVLLFSTGVEQTKAAGGYQGYAVYRDNVLYGYTWHAGIMYQKYASDYQPVVQAPGPGSVVKHDTWSGFLTGDKFMGVYRPNADPSSAQRDLFVVMARNMATYNISYTIYNPISVSPATGTYVKPGDIYDIRCDGVVEYIYEYYGFRVYGSNSGWNISYNSAANRSAHSGMNPQVQTNYLTLITKVTPN